MPNGTYCSDSIRQDTPQNEVERAAMSNFADLMGRAAVHSGKMITWDEMFNSNVSVRREY